VLQELHVAHLGVVRDATLSLNPGLNVLTGETGAGKTLITVGLALALGARSSQTMVRTGRPALAAEARFRVDRPRPELEEWLEPPESTGAARELVLARTVGSEGRSSARVNGKLAPVSVLGALGTGLVEIHGQNQAERLMDAAAQLEFLDRFLGSGHLADVDRYRSEFVELRNARAALEELEGHARERERERDLLEYQIREIEGVNLAPGEMLTLQAEEARLAHAERIRELVAAAEDAVGAEGGAADALRRATASLQAAQAVVPEAGALAGRAASTVAETEDLLTELRRYQESVQVDPARLDAVRERLQAIRTLERKYGEGEDGILAYLEEARVRLAGLEGEQGARAELEDRVRSLLETTAAMATGLTAARTEGAPRLAAALGAEILQLGMPGASIGIDLVAVQEATPDGAEGAEFRFAGGSGQAPLPLSRVASGGELSRVMLACRSVLADLDDVPTLVFDEVDAGIGGRTAHAVAERLAVLSGRRQVVVVTHLAQIAARADRHLVVSKDRGEATVRAVDGEERVEEVARMLSGTTGEVPLAHARELLEGGEGPPARRPARTGAGGRA
jgi:DNA repair protein RecN (Recombination protein N)